MCRIVSIVGCVEEGRVWNGMYMHIVGCVEEGCMIKPSFLNIICPVTLMA